MKENNSVEQYKNALVILSRGGFLYFKQKGKISLRPAKRGLYNNKAQNQKQKVRHYCMNLLPHKLHFPLFYHNHNITKQCLSEFFCTPSFPEALPLILVVQRKA